MTQNTADRLYLLLVDRLRVIGGTRHAAEDIAAEIDGLTAERDAARAEVAKLKEQNRILATTSLRDVIKSVHPSGRARGQ